MLAGVFHTMSFGEAFAVVFLLLMAPAVGSFLGVLVDRLPRQEDVFRQRSRCRDCQHPLAVWDLVPVLSYVWLGGKCRYCRAALSPWHLYMEVAAFGLAVVAVSAGGDALQTWLSTVFLWLLLALLAADLIWFRLPDPLNAALLVVAVGVSVQPGQIGLKAALIGAFLGVVIFLALRIGYQAMRKREGLGLGDVKLMAGLGAFAGPWDLPLLLLIASLGALLAGVVGLRNKRSSTPIGLQRLPFGAALCAAAMLLWVLRQGHIL